MTERERRVKLNDEQVDYVLKQKMLARANDDTLQQAFVAHRNHAAEMHEGMHNFWQSLKDMYSIDLDNEVWGLDLEAGEIEFIRKKEEDED